jgi:hypothetical protein
MGGTKRDSTARGSSGKKEKKAKQVKQAEDAASDNEVRGV